VNRRLVFAKLVKSRNIYILSKPNMGFSVFGRIRNIRIVVDGKNKTNASRKCARHTLCNTIQSLGYTSRWARSRGCPCTPFRIHGDHIFCSLGPCRRLKTCPHEKKLSSSMFTTSKSKPHICISKLCFWGKWHNTPENIAHFRPFWSRCEMFSTISLPPKHIVYL